MREVAHEYSVYVGDRENYIVKAQTFSRNDAINVAHALSAQFPNFTIIIEEWRFVFSSEFLESGLFRGEVITIPAMNRKEAA